MTVSVPVIGEVKTIRDLRSSATPSPVTNGNPLTTVRNAYFDNPVTGSTVTLACTTVPPMGEAYMYDPWVMMSSGWLTPAPTKPTLGTALPQWFALCALKTASSSPIKVVGGGGGKTTPLKMHCGYAVGDRPPGSALKVFTVRCPPK